MDKYTNNLKIEEIRRLAEEFEYDKALQILDTIDVDNERVITDLSVFADVYTHTKRYEEAFDILQRIYEKHVSKRIIYQLTDISIRMGNEELAEEYYNEYVDLSEDDANRYKLRYRIDRMRGCDFDTLIKTLEKLKEYEYDEKWAYELAKLYHKSGFRDKCVRECSDIIVWFNEGVIVERAKLLKSHYVGAKEKRVTSINASDKKAIEEEKDLAKTKNLTDTINKVNVLLKQEDIKENIIENKIKVKNGVETISIKEPIEKSSIIEAVTLKKPEEVKDNVELSNDSDNLDTKQQKLETKKEINSNDEREVFNDSIKTARVYRNTVPIETKLGFREKRKNQENLAEENVKNNLRNYEREHEKLDNNIIQIRKTEDEKDDDMYKDIADIKRELFKTRSEKEINIEEKNIESNEKDVISPKIEVVKDIIAEEDENILELKKKFKELQKEAEINKTITEKLIENEESTAKIISEEINNDKTLISENIESVIHEDDIETIIKPEVIANIYEDDVELKGKKAGKKKSPFSFVKRIFKKVAGTSRGLAEKLIEEDDYEEDSEYLIQEDSNIPNLIASLRDDENKENNIEKKNSNDNDDVNELLDSLKKKNDDKVKLNFWNRNPENEVEVNNSEEINNKVEEKVIKDIEKKEKLNIELIENNNININDEVSATVEEVKENISIPKEKLSQDKTIFELVKERDIQELKEKEYEDVYYNNLCINRIFKNFMNIQSVREQIIASMENVLNTENYITFAITGSKKSGKTKLAKMMAKTLYRSNILKQTKVAKIDANRLNNLNLEKTQDKLIGGLVVIENAGSLNQKSIDQITNMLHSNKKDVGIVFEDTRENMDKILSTNTNLFEIITNNINLPIYNINNLMGFARNCLMESNYIMDEASEEIVLNVIEQIIGKCNIEERLDCLIKQLNMAILSAEKRILLTELPVKKDEETGKSILEFIVDDFVQK